jgi:hypothetical protein
MSCTHTYRFAARFMPIVASVLVSQAASVAAEPIVESAAHAATADQTPRLSPWRDAWYLDDRTPHGTDQHVGESDAPPTTPPAVPRPTPRRDAWYLEQELTSSAAAEPSPGRASLDLSLRAHDDWPLDRLLTTEARQP